VALVAWAGALEGYLLRPTLVWERALLFLAAFGLLHAGLATDLAGIAILTAVLLSQHRRRRAALAAPDVNALSQRLPAGRAGDA